MSNILIRGVTVLTMESRDKVIPDGIIAIAGNRILVVGSEDEIPDGFIAGREIDGAGMVALPGLVNCHTHAAMTLLRSYADDLPLMKWLNEKIWPLEAKMQSEDFYWGTMLCCLEMIKSGTTTFADMYFEMNQIARAVKESGMRACLSRGMIGFGPGAQKAVDESISFVEEWHGRAGGRITAMFGPHATYTCPPEYLKNVIELAGRYGVGVHIHVAETKDEVRQIRDAYGASPVRHLDAVGVFEAPTLAAHCVYLDEADIEILAEKKVGVVHCPESNMKLASGISPVVEMLEAGVIVGLGTDGASSNNNLDMMEEMHSASLLQKVACGDPEVMPAFKTLQMATCDGAQALRLPDVGMLKAGMKADIILVDFRRPHLRPRHDIIAHMVYSAQSADIDTVIIDGELVMEGRQVLTIDEKKVMAEAQRCADRLMSEI